MFKQILLGSVMAVAAATGANAVIIDDFSDAPQRTSLVGPEVEPGGSDPTDSAIDNAANGASGEDLGPHASIIGGYRDLVTQLIVSPNEESFTRSNANIGGNGIFTHSQDDGVGSNTYLTWDGLEGAGLGSYDLSGDTRFHLIVLSADDEADWSLEVFDGDSSFLYPFSNPQDVNEETGPLDLYLNFSLFAGIDFSDIEKIVFGANTSNGLAFDTSVDLFETVGVPEPASMTLLGAGIMGLGYFGKRRKG